jgi:hypothetical protein
MSFQDLENHDAIAWDFDGTLYRHPKSPAMHRFILDHPSTRHVIVTFRSHGMQHDIWDLLDAAYGAASPTRDHFESVLNIADEIYERFAEQDRIRRMRKLAGQSDAPPHPDETAYTEWKGRICREHGLTVLVDDKIEHTLEGCEKAGVCFINPDDL